MKVLVCAVPDVSLFIKKHYVEIGLETSILTKYLRRHDWTVEYYDLNVALNASHLALTAADMQLLMNPAGRLYEFTQAPDQESSLYQRVSELASAMCSQFEMNHDAILLSMNRVLPWRWSNLSTLSFTVILASLLSQEYGIPVDIGGRLAFRAIGITSPQEQFLREVKLERPEKTVLADEALRAEIDRIAGSRPIRFFYTHTAPEYVQELATAIPTDSLYTSRHAVWRQHRQSAKSISDVGCAYDIRNKQDLMCDYERLFPRDIIEKYPIIQGIEDFFVAPLRFGSGCRYKCAFCTATSVPFQTQSPSEMVDVLSEMVEVEGVTSFRILTNMVNFTEKHVFGLCNEIVRRGLKISWTDSGDCRHPSAEIFRALKEAGCVKLWFGAESVSDRILNMIGKDLTADLIVETLTNADDAGIWNAINVITNMPTETDDEVAGMVDFIARNQSIIDCHQINRFLLYKHAEMGILPDKFGVKVREGANAEGEDYVYDEIDGQTWEEIVARGNAKVQRIASLDGRVNPLRNRVFRNDYLLFALSQVTSDKRLKKAILSDYADHLERIDGLADFALQYDPLQITDPRAGASA